MAVSISDLKVGNAYIESNELYLCLSRDQISKDVYLGNIW